MDRNFQSQFDRANELLLDLHNSYNADLTSKVVSERTKNLSQEIMVKIKSSLDQAMRKFYTKHYQPTLAPTDHARAKVYFPIVGKKEDLKGVLGWGQMKDLEIQHPVFYKFLDSVQPYHQEFSWLKKLADFSADKHIDLTPQVHKEFKELHIRAGGMKLILGDGAAIKLGPQAVARIGNVTMYGEQIISADNPIKNLGNEFQEVITWSSLLYEGTDLDVLKFCEAVIRDAEKIIIQTLDFCGNK
jgi:hypothetical protein